MVLVMIQANLYIFNFEAVVMKRIKKIIATILFFTLLLGCGEFFQYILVDDTTSYTRIMMHELYSQEDNIDILFVGSSHCYRSFNPAITDEIFQQNTFNAGSSAQRMDGSYTIIKEAMKNNNIKHIFLEVYFGVAEGFDYKTSNQLTSTYIISDYMKPSVNKLLYLINASQPEHYFNSFVLARREWQSMFDLDYMMELINKKHTEDYYNYTYKFVSGKNEYYAGKGYVVSTDSIDGEVFYSDYGCEALNINSLASQDWEKYLWKIINLCDKENIKLTLISAPIPDYCLASCGNYDEYINKINSIIEYANVDYYDFNLCREEYWPCTTQFYYDTSHLNKQGADLFSQNFALFFSGKIAEETLFYSTYQDRIASLKPQILGLNYEVVNIENVEKKRMHIISTFDTDTKYKVVAYPKEGEEYVVQDYINNNVFLIDDNEHGVLNIIVKKNNDTTYNNSDNMVVINY